jgi:hypothetical protein
MNRGFRQRRFGITAATGIEILPKTSPRACGCASPLRRKARAVHVMRLGRLREEARPRIADALAREAQDEEAQPFARDRRLRRISCCDCAVHRIGQLVRKARKKVRRHGFRRAAYVALLKALGCHRWLNVLRGHYVEEIDPAFLQFPQRYVGSFLTPRVVGESTRDPEAGITGEFVQYALAKGDKCYAFTHDGSLRAYGWYATTPTRVSPDLRLHFSRDYIYMYRGFTHESHRGKRLFPIGMTRALRHYRAAGYKGMLLYVDSDNLDSLKSCARIGLRVFGSVYIAKIFGRTFIYSTPGCARFGFRIEEVSAADWRNASYART